MTIPKGNPVSTGFPFFVFPFLNCHGLSFKAGSESSPTI
jgi:hypothetical protein